MGRHTFRNLRIWDGVGERYVDADSITIQETAIAAVARVGNGVDSRDMSGLTAVLGLIDAHVHMTLDPSLGTPEEQMAQPDAVIELRMVERAEAMVRAGITTARDLGGGKWQELALRDRINAGKVPGPRLLCAGQPVTSMAGHYHFWSGEAADARAAAEVIARQAAHGVDLIKIMATGGNLTKGSTPRKAQFDADTIAEIVRAARERGYDVAAHCHGAEGIDYVAQAGVRTIEHCSWLGEDGARTGYDPAVAAMIAAKEVWVSPTINAGWKRFTGGDGKFEVAVQNIFAAMREAGVRLIASTDAGIPNVWHHDLARALPVLAHYAGLSPLETLRSATSECAEAIGLGAVTGRIKTGFSAGIVFVDGDPLADLSVLKAPALVVARGREFC